MNKVSVKLTVFFADSFWVGVFEKENDGKLSVAKVTFGAEPRDYEVYEYILNHYYSLHFSPTVESNAKESKVNLKRMQKETKKQIQNIGIGTKSQQALKLQREEFKLEHKEKSREQKLAEKQRLFDMKQLKKMAKHRGR